MVLSGRWSARQSYVVGAETFLRTSTVVVTTGEAGDPPGSGCRGLVAWHCEWVKPPPEQVADLVRRLVASPWPTSEAERAAWFAEHGLPTYGQPSPGWEQAPRSEHAIAEGPPGWGATEWHAFDGAFVGLCWFLWFEDPEPDTRAAAEALQDAFDRAWPRVDSLDDPVQGLTRLWATGEAQVDLYVHAPRVTPRGDPTRGGVQLHVDHAARAAAEDAVATTSQRAGATSVAPKSRTVS